MRILIEEYGSIVITCLAVTVSSVLLRVILSDYRSFTALLLQGLMYH